MIQLFEKFTTWVVQRREAQDERDNEIRALSRMNRAI